MNQAGNTDERSSAVGGRRTSAAEGLARATRASHLGVIVDGALKACRLDCSARARKRVKRGFANGSDHLFIHNRRRRAPAPGRPVPTHRHIHRGTDGASTAKTPLEPVCSTDRVCVICIVLHLVVLCCAAAGASPDLAGAFAGMSWEVRVAAVAASVAELRHVGASISTHLGVGRRTAWAF